MNVLPGVTEIVAEVQERFGDRLDAVRADRPNEIYFDAGRNWSPASPPIFIKNGMRGW